MAIRQKLIAARKRRGLSQEEAAAALGVIRPTLSNWEMGVRDPYPHNIKALCAFYGVNDPAALDLLVEPRALQRARTEQRELHSSSSLVVTNNLEYLPEKREEDRQEQQEISGMKPTYHTSKVALHFNSVSMVGLAEGARMVVQYWWLRYGNYRPGRVNLPHMGDVIADYRTKRYSSQAAFAQATGVDKQTVAYWESLMYLSDPERRIFLAKMLKIPPALLGLTWQQVIYQDHAGTYTDPLDHLAEIVEEDAYYHYEDTLIMAWGWFYNGRLLDIADRFERRLRKLENKVQYIPEHDKEAWKELLCHYRYLATQIARHRGMDNEHKRQALRLNAGALQLAQEIEDPELIAHMFSNRSDIQFEQEHYSQAKAMSRAAIEKAEQIRIHTPLYGTIHLMAAMVFAPYTSNDDKLAAEVRSWLDKTLNIVYTKNIEPDRSFLKLNLAAVHHERAKAFLQFHQFHPHYGYLKDASNEIKLAWEAFTPDLMEWKVFFHLTEARILEAGKDLEGSAKLGLEALKAARDMQSKKREPQLQELYHDLMNIDAGNPQVHNLGAELGIFP